MTQPHEAGSPGWTPDELDRIGAAEELRIAPVRSDGSPLSRFRRIWVVRVGDQLYVRSAYGPDSGWYRRVRSSRRGRIRAEGIEYDVSVIDVPETEAQTHAAVDAAYHAKYDRHGPRVVGTVVGPDAARLTLRLRPARS